jgi:hypothetical protein
MVKNPKEEYCYGCECLLLTPQEKLGPFCGGCFKKVKARNPLTQAVIRQTLVAVVPSVCPHDEERGHRCRTKFNVMVLNKRLQPIEITGPYSQRAADRKAKRIQDRIDRSGK